MNEITESILADTMMFVFNQKVNDMVLGKYETPNVVDKCVDDITSIWTKLMQTAIKDGYDLDKIEELWGDIDYIRLRVAIDRKYDLGYPVRSLEYVQQECRNLVDQIIEWETK